MDPITNFISKIERLEGDQWQAKVQAVTKLVDSINAPLNYDSDNESIASRTSVASNLTAKSTRSVRSTRSSRVVDRLYPSPEKKAVASRRRVVRAAGVDDKRNKVKHDEHKSSSNTQQPWYKDARELKRLAPTFNALVSDLRSQLVKAACAALAKISEVARNSMRLLVKDILWVMIAMHAQTVKTIQSYALHAMLVIIQNVKFASSINLIIDNAHAKKSRSKDVRHACVQYMKQIVECWSAEYLEKEKQNLGASIINAMSDSVQDVRSEARNAFVSLHAKFPMYGQELLMSLSDIKLRKNLQSQCAVVNNTGTPSSFSPEKPPLKPKAAPLSTVQGKKREKKEVPPPVNLRNPFSSAIKSPVRLAPPPPPAQKQASTYSEPERSLRRMTSTELEQEVSQKLMNNAATKVQAVIRGSCVRRHSASLSPLPPRQNTNNIINNNNKRASTMALKRRMSSLLINDDNFQDQEQIETSAALERHRVAVALLEAHQNDVSGIMNDINYEMNLIREFEKVHHNASEDQILDYFEKVQQCIDTRIRNAKLMEQRLINICDDNDV